MYQKGQSVLMYQDPITQTTPEGRAVLIHGVNDHIGRVERGALQRWNVRFAGERDTFERTILQPHEEEPR